MKRSFTLFELIIAMILISLLYYFAINSFENKNFKTSSSVSLYNLKNTLLNNYSFEKSIEIQCIDDDLSCFLFIDGKLQKTKINSLFNTKPIVYTYTPSLEKVNFKTLELEEMEDYDIVFKYKCQNTMQCDEYIVEANNKIFLFNDIYKYPKELKSTNDVDEYFEKLQREVKDAF